MKLDLKLRPSELVEKRNKISADIMKFWNIISTENVIKKGAKRNYDLHQVLIQIKALYDQLIVVKLRIQCTNMGIKFEKLSKNANIINIYKLSAYNEYNVKLMEMMKHHTISPAIKIKKGKKGLSVTEELTYDRLNIESKKIQLELNALRKAITDFNDNTDITDDSTPLFLVV